MEKLNYYKIKVSFKVFISHSVAPGELGIVYAMANEAAKRGASPFIPDRDWKSEDTLPERIHLPLEESDYVLAIATSSGFQLPWLNREIKEASKRKKEILLVADKGIKVLSKLPCIRIDRTNPTKTIYEVSACLAKFGKDKQTKELLTWIGIGGILFLLLLGREK